MPIGTALSRFFYFAFPAGRSKKAERADLKRITKRLGQLEPLLYAPLSDELKPEFAQAVSVVRVFVAGINPVMQKTLLNQEQKTVQGLQRRFLSRYLQSHGLTIESFAFDEISSDGEQDAPKSVQDADAKFRLRMTAFKAAKLRPFLKGYEELLRLAALCTFDYDGLLEKFGPIEKKGSDEVVFRSCAGNKAADLLLDLYFVTGGFEPSGLGIKQYKVLAKLAGNSAPGDDALIKAFSQLQGALQTAMSTEILGNIIRVVKMDPYFELDREQPAITFVADTRASLEQKYTTARDAYAKQVARKRVRAQMRELFGSEPVVVLAGYNSQVNAQLVGAGLQGYKYVNAITLLKTFDARFYSPAIKASYQALLDKGQFISEEVNSQLVDAFSASNDLEMTVSKFEEDLSDSKFSELPAVLKKLAAKKPEGGGLQQTQKVIDGINTRADQILQAGTGSLNSLMSVAKEVLEDAKLRDPRILENSRFLKANERDIFSNLKKSVAVIRQFIRLMGNFIVNVATVKAQINKQAP